MQLNVTTPDEVALVRSAEKSLQLVQAIAIDCPEMYAAAGAELQVIKAKAKAIEEERVKITGPINEGLRRVNAMFKRPLEVLEQAEKMLKGSMIAFTESEQRRRDEEQRQAQEQARLERDRLQREADERERIAREERERVENESRQRLEEENRRAEELRQQGNTEAADETTRRASETADREHREAEERENEERQRATTVRETAAIVTAAPVATSITKAAGASMRKNWKAEVTDKAALIKHVAANPHLVNLLDVNDSALNKMAKALELNLNLPGVRPWNDVGLAVRAAA